MWEDGKRRKRNNDRDVLPHFKINLIHYSSLDQNT